MTRAGPADARCTAVTIFDYIVLFILISSVIISTLRGLVKEILSLAGWVVAFVVANAFGAKLAPMLPSLIPGDAVRLMVAFIALFLGVRILMGLLALAIGALIEATGLTPGRPWPRRFVRTRPGDCNRAGRRHIVWNDFHSPTGFLERRAALADGGNRRAHREAFLAGCLCAARAVLNSFVLAV